MRLKQAYKFSKYIQARCFSDKANEQPTFYTGLN